MTSEILLIGIILSLILTFHFGFILGREYKNLQSVKEKVLGSSEMKSAGEIAKKILQIKKPVAVIHPEENYLQKKAEAEKDGKELPSWRD